MLKKVAIAMTAVALVGIGQAAWSASPATSNMSVSASVANNCTISSAPTFAFGTYDPVATNLVANLDVNTTLAIKCTKNATGVSVGFNDGANFSATRRLSDGGGTPTFLNYDLYQPTAVGVAATCPYTTRWGAAIGTDTVAVGSANFSTSATAVTLRVCGRIPGAQDAATGSYNDTVQLQVNF
jgi:spore coat protein U-like protein